MVGVRKDVATLGGPWSADILWYARAVKALRTRSPSDPTSWTYLAAIHGIDASGWVRNGLIPSLGSLPPPNIQNQDFNQCQHSGWFFLPWHRGYLAAFEAIVAEWIAAQPGAPSDWALPYWNYLNAADPASRAIPPEFLSQSWPDGRLDNPLLGPRPGTHVLGPQPWLPRADINLGAQTTPMPYTAAPGTVGYGGAISGFSSDGDLTGALEGNPHNTVHVMIGGIGPGSGWMSDPAYAALDPIFWLHHCNIDRLWAAWMSNSANIQESSSPWKNGPFPRQFVMPDAAGNRVIFVPGDTLPGGILEPDYDNLSVGTGIAPGGAVVASVPLSGGGTSSGGGSSLVGANNQPLTVAAGTTATQVTLDTAAAPSVFASATGSPPARYYLNLEGIRGDTPSAALSVSIKAADSAQPAIVETVTLFGLGRASSTQGRHAGNGLSVAIEITDKLLSLKAAPASLAVEISQPEGTQTPITVDRVSIYKSPE